VKILLITATYPPSVNGVAVSVNGLFEEFKKGGHEVFVLAPNNKKGRDKRGVVRYPSISNPVVSDYPIPLLPVSTKVIKLLTETDFDIVHAHHPFYISFFADVVSTMNNIPFLFTHHTRYDEYLKTTFGFLPERIKSKISDYRPTRVYKRADLIVAPSKAIKKDLLKREIDTKVEVVPTGLPDFEVPKQSKESLRRKYKLPRDRKLLLCVSRISDEKNIKLLLESLKLLPDKYNLVLVGTGPARDDLREYSEENDIRNRIWFVGKVSHSRIPELYSLSDIFVFPSYAETQGLVLLEAAYFGVPTVAVESDVNKEWVVEGAGVLAKNDPASFRQAILEVDGLDKKRVEKKSREFALEFTSEKTAARMLEVYQEAIKKGRKPGKITRKFKERIKELEDILDRYIKD
jgi:glycosyltransferase involved in cell wall biosynthesis